MGKNPFTGGRNGRAGQGRAVAVLWLAAAMLLLSRPVWAAQIVVVAPPDRAWVSSRDIFLAGMVEGGGLGLQSLPIAGVANKAVGNAVPVDEGGAFGVLITLKEGENVVTLGSGALEKKVRLFYAVAGRNAPGEFTRFYVHGKPAPLDCKECHRLRGGQYNFSRIVPARANCTTGACHAGMGKSAYVHGPVGAGVCISCHNPHGSAKPLAMERTGQELCLVCHQDKPHEFTDSVVHAPVQEGCLDCHNPHESSLRFQLRGSGPGVSGLCFTCHEAAIFTRPHRHGPVGTGDCIACHRPHSSRHKSLLIASPAKGEVCFQCHQERKEEFAMKHIHRPVAEDCGKCHDPHSSNARHQLHKSGGELCASCHAALSPAVYSEIKGATHKHPPADQGRCTECHRPHSSAVKSLLKSSSLQNLCFTCHDELGNHVAESRTKHGPVQTGDCLACHRAHGSRHSRLLARYFPEEFYKEYAPENYDLCFGCHNKDIAKNKFTRTLTNFRDGDYNLHFFHVNMKKGRNCVACHDAHASSQAKHIRTEVPFGSWSYPIALTRTAEGGTCVVGCHAPKGYDRSRPLLKPAGR